jgi:hypothetical protein
MATPTPELPAAYPARKPVYPAKARPTSFEALRGTAELWKSITRSAAAFGQHPGELGVADTQ